MNKNFVRYKIITGFILFLAVVFIALLFYRAVNAETTGTYYSDSIRLDGTYDAFHVMFSWKPSMMPGYQIDLATYPDCPGEVRVEMNNIIEGIYCANILYYEPGNNSYYFIAYINPLKVCGKSGIELEPWLAVYNPISNVHDVIFGLAETVDLSDCKSIKLPIIRK